MVFDHFLETMRRIVVIVVLVENIPVALYSFILEVQNYSITLACNQLFSVKEGPR